MKRFSPIFGIIGATASVRGYLSDLPTGFNATQWAYVSYSDPSVAVLSGSFNRSAFDAPHEAKTSDPGLTEANKFVNSTQFIAYDDKFFDIIGPSAKVEHVQPLALQIHESPCFNPETKELYFTEWGPPGGIDGEHLWQYILDTTTNELHNVTTDPPTVNAHGCVVYKGMQYVVTDGNHEHTGTLVKIDPKTMKMTTILNNYYQQPFLGFNDIDIDADGNFWLTDSRSAWGKEVTDFYPQTLPTVYRVDGRTMRPKVVHVTTGNANGIAVGPRNKDGKHSIYIPDTGVSIHKPEELKDPKGDRALRAFDASPQGGILTNGRFLNNPIAYFYDGIRVSRNGWIFAGAGDGLDVIDPDSGYTLGTIRVGGGENLAVNLALGEHELWIVGKGGVWHVSGVEERLDREW